MKKPTPQGRHYNDANTPYTQFLKFTTQKRICAKVLLHAIVPTLRLEEKGEKEFWNYADVGCGSGEITIPVLEKITKDYPKLTIRGVFIEPSNFLLEKMVNAINRIPSVEACYINEPIEGLYSNDIIPWGENDFLLCSHSLAYMQDWKNQAKKMLASISIGGKACFVLHASTSQVLCITRMFLGKLDLMDEFCLVGEDVEKEFRDSGVEFTVESVNSEVIFPLEDVVNMPLSPDSTESGLNIAYDLARLYTYPNYWHLSTMEMLEDIQRFFFQNRRGNNIHLGIHESYIYCKGKPK